MLEEKYPFATRVQQPCKELSKLKRLQLPQPLQWKIDWGTVQQIHSSNSTRNESKGHLFFSEIKLKRNHPSIYSFSVPRKQGKGIFEAYTKVNITSSDSRINHGVKHPDFRNVCHVPSTFKSSACLYVGSVKKNVRTRILQHLAFTKSGRTRALYLLDLLPHLPILPNITIYFFDRKYSHLTEYMEYVFQPELTPILGKRSIKDFTPIDL